MRLKQRDIDAIKQATLDVFGASATVRLFGSRIHDHLRGGDIDLHIEVDAGQEDVAHAARFRQAIFARIDEQAIDLVFRVRGRPERSIDHVALSQGVLL